MDHVINNSVLDHISINPARHQSNTNSTRHLYSKKEITHQQTQVIKELILGQNPYYIKSIMYGRDDMRTYIDIIFNPDMNPAEFAKDMIDIHMRMLFGPHDFVIEWDTYEEFQQKFKNVLNIIKKYKLNYRLQTFEESEEDLPFMSVALSK